MKILNAGDHLLSNADVLDWVKRKRMQHAAEDARDKANGLSNPHPRPRNFLTVLNRTQRELSSNNYPYVKNPSVYDDASREERFREFALRAENAVLDHLEQDWKPRLAGMTKAQVEKEFVAEQEKKCLTETELLVIFNHAPICIDLLQPMIENVEERFTTEEQQLLVEVIITTLRPDEKIPIPER